MRKQPPPFARMLIRRDELEMMPRVGLMRARERQSKMLLLFGQLFRRGVFGLAKIVHPKDALLFAVECARMSVGGSGYQHPQEFRHGSDFERFLVRETHGLCLPESLRDSGCLMAIQLEERLIGFPGASRIGQDIFRSTITPKTGGSFVEQCPDTFGFGSGQGVDLPQGVIQCEFVAYPALQARGPDCERTRRGRGQA